MTSESETVEKVPARLRQIIEDFQLSEGQEKIELLLEYSEKMPVLPENSQHQRDEMDFVEECMTPVYVLADVSEGGFHFYFDIPPESPTVRGFAALLAEGLDGATAEQILGLPNDFFRQMGLEKVLSMQRLNGLTAIVAHMKRIAANYLASDAG